MDYYSLKLKKTTQRVISFFGREEFSGTDKITALCTAENDEIFIGTDTGLTVYESGIFFAVDGINGSVNTLCCYNGSIFAACGRTVYRVVNRAVNSSWELDAEVAGISKGNDNRLFLVTRASLYDYTGSDFVIRSEVFYAQSQCFAAVNSENIYVSCPKALMMLHGKRPRWSTMMPGISGVPDSPVSALAADAFGHLFVGCEDGLYIYDGKSEWLSPAKLTYFPKTRITEILLGADGAVYAGTDKGLYIIDAERTAFLGKGRYLKESEVTAVTLAKGGKELWVGTERGLSRIENIYMSLSEKEAHYDSLMKYFYREGFILGRCNTVNNDIGSGCVHISDNDGLWTATYVMSQALKFAVTNDEKVLENARVSVNALMKLATMTGIDGFPARAYRRPGEDNFGNGDPEWHASSDETGPLEWKGETSSDELVGHYTAYSWYYDLCADDKEKQKISEVVCSMTDHITEHGYTLCDADGMPTTWAHFSPRELNTDDKWCWEKGINSLELLSFLKTSYHMSGNEKYQKLYSELVAGEHYAMNTLLQKVEDCHTSHIDDKLGFYIIMPLLRYEENTELLRFYKLALRRHYEYEKCEHCPLYSFIYTVNTGSHASLDEAVDVLEKFPLDLQNRNVDNSIRPDIEIETETEEFGEEHRAKYALSADERVLGKICYNAFKLEGGDGKSFEAPSTWLSAYWYARYYGLIEE